MSTSAQRVRNAIGLIIASLKRNRVFKCPCIEDLEPPIFIIALLNTVLDYPRTGVYICIYRYLYMYSFVA